MKRQIRSMILVLFWLSRLTLSHNWIQISDTYGTPWPWFVNGGTYSAYCKNYHLSSAHTDGIITTEDRITDIQCQELDLVRHDTLCPVNCQPTDDKCSVGKRCPTLIMKNGEYSQSGRKKFYYPYHTVCTDDNEPHKGQRSTLHTTGTLCDFDHIQQKAKYLSATRYDDCKSNQINVRFAGKLVQVGQTIYMGISSKTPIEITLAALNEGRTTTYQIRTNDPNRVENVTTKEANLTATTLKLYRFKGREIQFVVNVTNMGLPNASFIAFIRIVDDSSSFQLNVDTLSPVEKQLRCEIDEPLISNSFVIARRVRFTDPMNATGSTDRRVKTVTTAGTYECILEIKGNRTCFPFVDEHDEWVEVDRKTEHVSFKDHTSWLLYCIIAIGVALGVILVVLLAFTVWYVRNGKVKNKRFNNLLSIFVKRKNKDNKQKPSNFDQNAQMKYSDFGNTTFDGTSDLRGVESRQSSCGLPRKPSDLGSSSPSDYTPQQTTRSSTCLPKRSAAQIENQFERTQADDVIDTITTDNHSTVTSIFGTKNSVFGDSVSGQPKVTPNDVISVFNTNYALKDIKPSAGVDRELKPAKAISGMKMRDNRSNRTTNNVRERNQLDQPKGISFTNKDQYKTDQNTMQGQMMKSNDELRPSNSNQLVKNRQLLGGRMSPGSDGMN